MSTQPAVDIDAKPDLTVDLQGRVVAVDRKPILLPAQYTEGRWLATLGRFVGDVTVTLSRRKRTRSSEANSYLWGVVYEDVLQGLRGIAQDAGEKCPFADKDELHEALKYRFLGLDVFEIKGEKVERPSTTTTLDPRAFGIYVDQVKRLAAERWGIYVREPGEGPL